MGSGIDLFRGGCAFIAIHCIFIYTLTHTHANTHTYMMRITCNSTP